MRWHQFRELIVLKVVQLSFTHNDHLSFGVQAI